MKNIAKIITILGGVKGLYASIDNAPYMRLVIEDIGRGPRGYQAVEARRADFRFQGALLRRIDVEVTLGPRRRGETRYQLDPVFRM
jgi:hypothetical protein